MPYDATEIPIEAVRAATAIPIIANLIGVRFGLEISLDNKSATNIDDIKHPKKVLNVPNENNPIYVDARKIVAPPPIPKVTKVPPPPTAPAAPTDTTAPAQTASVPGDITLKPGRALRVLFDGTATKLPADAEAGLVALADAVRDAKDYRLQLMAYAGVKDLTTSKVRRISLSRALAVRSFLIDKGVRSTQIDVRALGNKTSEKPVNRVDVNLAQR